MAHGPMAHELGPWAMGPYGLCLAHGPMAHKLGPWAHGPWAYMGCAWSMGD